MARTVDVDGVVISVPDPQVIAQLQFQFQSMGDACGDAAEQLSALASPQAVTSWTGFASDAFAQTIGPLPGHLDRARDAYHAAAATLSQYADQVGPLVADLYALSLQVADATSELSATQAARDQLAQQDPLSPDLPGLSGRLVDAQTAVTGLQATARAKQADLENLAASCAASIRQARPPGPGLLSRLGHDIASDVLKPVGHVVKKVVVNPFIKLGDAADKFWNDPSLANLSAALADLVGVVGVVGLLVPGLGELLAPVLLASMAAAVATDAMAEERGEISPRQGVDELGDVMLSGGGALLGAGAAGERALADDALDSGAEEGLGDVADGAGDLSPAADSLPQDTGGLLHGAGDLPKDAGDLPAGADDLPEDIGDVPDDAAPAAGVPEDLDDGGAADGGPPVASMFLAGLTDNGKVALADLTQQVQHPLQFLADRTSEALNQGMDPSRNQTVLLLDAAGRMTDKIDTIKTATEPDQ